MAQEISYISLFYFFLTVIPILFIMKYLGINLIKKTWTALLRMSGQLILVGLYLQYIFNLNNSLINIGYITLMTLVAVWTIAGEIRF
ncbi:MAG: ABC transporter permease, partial [Fusobacteriaceae bacterium]